MLTLILPTHRSASPAASPPPPAAPPPHDLPLPPPPPGPPPPAPEAAELPGPPSPGPPGGAATDAPLPGPPPPAQPLPGAPPPGYFPPAPGFNPGWQARPPFGGGPPPPGYGGPPPPPTPQVEGSLFPSTGLPPRLAPLFKPRDPLPYAPPPRRRTARVGWTGVGGLVSEFASPGDGEHCPPRPPGVPASPRRLHNAEYAFQARLDALTPLERVAAAAEEKRAAGARARDAAAADYDPSSNPAATSDAFKTLFVGRLPRDATERDVRREFEEYGPIARVVLVTASTTGTPRGYAFIEYDHASDMKAAYKRGGGRRLGGGGRLVVDVERGRTARRWRPARLGGGRGGEGRVAREPRNAVKRRRAGLPPLPKGAAMVGGVGWGDGPPPPWGGPPPPPWGVPPPPWGGPPPPWGGPPPFDRGGGGPPPPPRDFYGGGDRDRDRAPWRDDRARGRDDDYGWRSRRSRDRSRSPRRRSRSPARRSRSPARRSRGGSRDHRSRSRDDGETGARGRSPREEGAASSDEEEGEVK